MAAICGLALLVLATLPGDGTWRPLAVIAVVAMAAMAAFAGTGRPPPEMRAFERAVDEAQAADAAKSRFLANVSHEIRTPLSGILGFAELLSDPDLSPDERSKAAAVVRRNSDYLRTLIDEILDFSKPCDRQRALRLESVETETLLSDVIALCSPRANAHSVDLTLVYAQRVPRAIRTDPTRLKQALLNLVSNAVKFAPTGSVTVSVSCDWDAERVSFAVRDTGIGIPQQSLEQIFEPYGQGAADIEERFGGTGLGLAITEKLARLLGGEVTVESRVGDGSCFTLTIASGPLGQTPARQGADTSGRTDTASATPSAISLPARVLLADDIEDNLLIYRAFLQRAGVEVVTARDGVEALACHRSAIDEPFDAILLDIQMPRMDGLAAASALREEGFHGPIIALSGHVLPADIDQCLRAGCNSHLGKPVRREALLRELSQQLAATGWSPASSAPTTVAEDAVQPS